jgi:hypothetical protein
MDLEADSASAPMICVFGDGSSTCYHYFFRCKGRYFYIESLRGRCAASFLRCLNECQRESFNTTNWVDKSKRPDILKEADLEDLCPFNEVCRFINHHGLR